MDIETIEFNGIQIPVMITTANGNLNKVFTIDYKLLLINKDLALKTLWEEYFKFVESNLFPVIFAHNLGNFDGYFIFKALSSYANPDKISTIIDPHNAFIQISLKTSSGVIINWRDSQRIFPVSLKELCKIFGIRGKISEYNTFLTV